MRVGVIYKNLCFVILQAQLLLNIEHITEIYPFIVIDA